MDTVYSGLAWIFLVIYLDDTNIHSPSFGSHLDHLEQTFQRLREAGLRLNIDKCHFCKEQLEFLGHIITRNGIQPDLAKIEKVKHFLQPTNTTELRGFLGLASYYRRFIQGFSNIAEPMHKLLKKDQRYEWKEEHEEAFKKLKEKLTDAPILLYPDFKKKFILATDASKLGIGAILSQLDSEGQERPVAYASRGLSPAEQNYAAHEMECLAVVWAVKYFRQYLLEQKFDLITDHVGLKWFITKSNPTGRTMRWIATLQEYDFNIIYKPGRKHSNVDALSRIPPNRTRLNPQTNPTPNERQH